jgi:FkbM family methyltransferase
MLNIIHILKKFRLLIIFEMIYDLYSYLKYKIKGRYSQNGEDEFILNYFGNKTSGTYIDVGANHPFKISNTYLLYNHGWRGVTVEPIPRLCKKQSQWRPGDIQLNCAIGNQIDVMEFYELTPGVLSTFDKFTVSSLIQNHHAKLVKIHKVNVIPLNKICLEYFIQKKIDVLSIDTEGYELVVLQSFDWNINPPTLVVVETTSPEKMAGENEVDSFLREKSYSLLRVIGANSIYSR